MSGLDCSGFVQILLEAAGVDPKGDQTAQGLYEYFYKNGDYNVVDFGSLAFFGRGPGVITHVAFLLDKGTMIEAAGGGSKTTTIDAAIAQNAFIMLSPLKKRSDLVAVIRPRYTFDQA
jgi:cell wall-associated NlpC family hydrolase